MFRPRPLFLDLQGGANLLIWTTGHWPFNSGINSPMGIAQDWPEGKDLGRSLHGGERGVGEALLGLKKVYNG